MARILRNSITKQQGMILAFILILMQSVLLIVFVSMSRAVSFIKAINEGSRERIFHENVTRALSKISLTADSPCLISTIPWSIISKKPLNWWQENGCERLENGVHYYHVVEAMGVDRCALTGSDDQSKWVADYYRLTLYAIAEGMRYQPIRLQATYLIPVLAETPCSGTIHLVKQGLQSLRE